MELTDSPWQYFSMKELTCQCGCGEMLMNGDYMVKIVAMRRELGFAFPITSAYRCPAHNNKVSSTGFDGPHTTGHSTDIGLSHEQAYKFMESAFRHGMTGIGVKQKGKRRFIHTDDLIIATRPRVWSY